MNSDVGRFFAGQLDEHGSGLCLFGGCIVLNRNEELVPKVLLPSMRYALNVLRDNGYLLMTGSPA